MCISTFVCVYFKKKAHSIVYYATYTCLPIVKCSSFAHFRLMYRDDINVFKNYKIYSTSNGHIWAVQEKCLDFFCTF